MTNRATKQSTPIIPEVCGILPEHHQTIVVGGGPTGLFLALRLAQAGINVLLLEAEGEIATSPRATTYMPIVCNELQKAGIYADLEAIGHKNREGISFRTPVAKGDQVLAMMRMSQVPQDQNRYEFAGIHAGQHQLADIILRHCLKLPSFSIRWGHRVVGTQNEEGAVQVVAITAQGERFFTCDYLVGCDGAGSAVRRSQCIFFEGFTWQDFRFVATNVKYDFAAFPGWTTANMVVDEKDWAVIARTGNATEGVWRVAYGVPGDTPDADCLKALPQVFDRLFPGPRPLQYELISANPYWAHQRCAATYRKGRILLCGDAAHANNPVGGLGLTTGLLDAAALAGCLAKVFQVSANSANALLERYARTRREAFLKFTNPASIDFKLRLHSFDDQTVEARERFFQSLNSDPKFVEGLARQMNEFVEEIW